MACKKDLGNYNYHSPAEPVISGLIDSTVNAIVGDSLIIRPGVSLADGDPAKDLFSIGISRWRKKPGVITTPVTRCGLFIT